VELGNNKREKRDRKRKTEEGRGTREKEELKRGNKCK